MILWEIDFNAILMKSMKNRSLDEISKIHKTLMDRLKATKIYPKKHILDIKGSNNCLQCIKEEGNFEKFCHTCTNPIWPKRQYRHSKITSSQSYPESTNDSQCTYGIQLLLQTELILHMLQAASIKPWVSAHWYMNSQHNYNRMSLAPLGCHRMTQNKLEIRTSWGALVSEGFYVGTSTEHYR